MSRKGTQRWSPDRRARVKRRLLHDYGSICQWCLTLIDPEITSQTDPMRYSVDHIVPWCDGGSNWIENLQPMHKYCNEMKGRKRS